MNPEVKVNKGQVISLTCEIDVNGVLKKDIKWSKDGNPITTGISQDRCERQIIQGGPTFRLIARRFVAHSDTYLLSIMLLSTIRGSIV